MDDDFAKPPYHIFERRYFEDTENRRIEFRQLVPGSYEVEPRPDEFVEFLGATTIGIVIMGQQHSAPVRFPIVAKGLVEAFAKFDVEAEKAKEQAKKLAEEKLKAKQKEMAGSLVLPGHTPGGSPGGSVPIISGM